MKIILGSSSPRRKELLSKIIKNFEIIPSNFDEDTIKQEQYEPEKLVETLSKLKGEEIYSRQKFNEDFIIISSDTMVFLNNQLLGKPKDKEESFKMLKSLQGNKHTVYTGLYVLINKNGSKEEILTNSKTDVYFRNVTDEEITEYINSENTLDKAGAYAVQGKAREFVEKIEGNIETVIGLDIEKLGKILEKNCIL
ncbi:MAG: septum formation protein Maf [Clostridia bacterium]|nr:septum formation protein Maf [Clostridia bacterium]